MDRIKGYSDAKGYHDWHPEPEETKPEFDPDATIIKKSRLHEPKETPESEDQYLGFHTGQKVTTRFGQGGGINPDWIILDFQMGADKATQGQMCAVITKEGDGEFTVPLTKLREWN